MSLTLDEVTLVVPALWDKPWDDDIADAEGLEREFLRAQARYASLLRGVPEWPVTPVKIGFLSLWSRLFGCLTGARGAALWESRFAVAVLARVAEEASLHLQAIMLPILQPASVADAAAWSEVRSRLAAYVVWTLRSDALRYRDLLSGRNLRLAFDPRPEREFARDLGPAADAWERMTHQRLEIISDEEAAFDQGRARDVFAERLRRVEHWLADDRLREWRLRLQDLERDQTKGPVTLFALLGLRGSVAAFAKDRGGPLGYFSYSRGSGFIHGSSLEASMMIAGPLMAPDFASLGRDFADAASSILQQLGLTSIPLSLLAEHISAADA